MVNLIQKKEYACIKDRMEEEMTRRLLDQKIRECIIRGISLINIRTPAKPMTFGTG